MADKKRNKKLESEKRNNLNDIRTFDDELDMLMSQTISSVVKAETFPQGYKNNQKSEDWTKIYHSPKSQKRYEQDPYTVAQNMVDRTQFRY